MGNNQTLLHATRTVEEVNLAVELNHKVLNVLGGILIIVGAVPASLVNVPVLPDVTLDLTVNKVESNAVSGSHATLSSCEGLGYDIDPLVVNHEPAGADLTKHEIAIHLCDVIVHHTGVVAQVSIAIHALELSVNQAVSVSGCGDGGTPIHNGITNVAEGAAGVAGGIAGSVEIVDCVCGVDVTAVPVVVVCQSSLGSDHVGILCPHLSIHEDTVAGEGCGGVIEVGQLTELDVSNQGDSPELLLVAELLRGECGLTGLSTIGIGVAGLQLPDANGDGSQNSLALGHNGAGAGDHDGGDVVVSVDAVGSGEALGQIHVIQLPGAQGIQVDGEGNALGGVNIGSDQVDVVDRAVKDTVQSCVVRNHLHGCDIGAGVHDDLTDHGAVVAHIIADGELNGVLTVSQLHIGDSDLAVAVGEVNGNAIDISLSGGRVQAGCVGSDLISYGSGEGQNVGLGGLTIQLGSVIGELIGIDNAGELRSVSVVHSLGVVDGNVVDVEGEVTGDVGIIGSVVAVGGAVTVGNVELHDRAGVQSYSGVCRGVDGQVVPAGLLEGGDNTSTAGSIIHILTGHAGPLVITVGILLGSTLNGPTSPHAYGLLGHIDPHTDASSVLEYHGNCGADQRGLLVTGLQGVGVVDPSLHSIVAGVDLTLLGGNNPLVAFRPYIVVLSACRFGEYQTAGGAVLEVEDDLRTLTQLQGSGSGDLGSKGECCGHLGGRSRDTLSTGSEGQAVKATDSGIAQSEGDIRIFQSNLVQTKGSGQTDLDSFPIRDGDGGVVELQSIRNNHVDNGGADNGAAVGHLNLNCTDSAVGNEHAVLDSTILAVSQLPIHILGNGSSGTGRANTGCGDLHGGARGHVGVLSGQNSTVELVGGCCQGGDDQTCRNRTLGTIGGTVHDGNVIFTLLTSSKGGGSTAVQVDCCHTTLLQHDLGQLVHSTTAGEGLLTAIQGHDNDLTVGSHTHAGTAVAIGVIRTVDVLGNIPAFVNQHLRACDSLPDLVVVSILQILGILNIHRTILLDCENLVVGGRLTDANAVQVSHAGGLTGGHVVEGCIDTCNDLIIFTDKAIARGVSVQLVSESNLVGELFHAEIAVDILLFVGCLNHNIITGDISSGYVINHLLAVLGIGVVNTLGYAGGNGRSGRREHVVSFRYKFCFCGKCAHGNHTQKHNDRKYKSHNFDEFRIFHVFLLCIFLRGCDLCKPTEVGESFGLTNKLNTISIHVLSIFDIFIKLLCSSHTIVFGICTFLSNAFNAFFQIRDILRRENLSRFGVNAFGASARMKGQNRGTASKRFYIDRWEIVLSSGIDKQIRSGIYTCQLLTVQSAVNRNDIGWQFLINAFIGSHQNDLIFRRIQPLGKRNEHIQAFANIPTICHAQKHRLVLWDFIFFSEITFHRIKHCQINTVIDYSHGIILQKGLFYKLCQPLGRCNNGQVQTCERRFFLLVQHAASIKYPAVVSIERAFFATVLPFFAFDKGKMRTVRCKSPAIVKRPIKFRPFFLKILEEHFQMAIMAVDIMQMDNVRLNLFQLCDHPFRCPF